MLKLEEILKNIIEEALNKSIPSPYDCKSVEGKYIPEKKDLRCQITTKLGNSYEIDFFTLEEPKTTLVNGKSIVEITDLISDDKQNAYFIGLGFTEKGKGRENSKEYDKVTGFNEPLDLLGRISSIVEQFIDKNPKYNILCILGDTDKQKLNIFIYLFNNQFKDKFDVYKSKSSYSDTKDAYYFIKK